MRSAQVYKILVDEADVIFNALEHLVNNDNDVFPRIERLQRCDDGDVEGTVHIEKYSNREMHRLMCDFLFRVNVGYLYLIGSGDARTEALRIINQSEGIDNTIERYEITNRELVEGIRDKLRKKNKNNFIKKINMEFGVAGIDYYNTTPLYKLDYELIENMCASTHRSFDEFIDHAIKVKARFGIRNLFNINRMDKSIGPASMNMQTIFSVSFYFDISRDDWYQILDFLTCTTG